MIEIHIKVKDDLIYDHLNDTRCTLQEVARALLRLKQIEQVLIDKEFESKLEISSK